MRTLLTSSVAFLILTCSVFLASCMRPEDRTNDKHLDNMMVNNDKAMAQVESPNPSRTLPQCRCQDLAEEARGQGYWSCCEHDDTCQSLKDQTDGYCGPYPMARVRDAACAGKHLKRCSELVKNKLTRRPQRGINSKHLDSMVVNNAEAVAQHESHCRCLNQGKWSCCKHDDTCQSLFKQTENLCRPYVLAEERVAACDGKQLKRCSELAKEFKPSARRPQPRMNGKHLDSMVVNNAEAVAQHESQIPSKTLSQCRCQDLTEEARDQGYWSCCEHDDTCESLIKSTKNRCRPYVLDQERIAACDGKQLKRCSELAKKFKPFTRRLS